MRTNTTERSQILFMSPGYITILLLIAGLVYTVYMSFYQYQLGTGVAKWIGDTNYINLMHDQIFRRAVVNTVIFVAAAASLEIGYGTILALALYWSSFGKVLIPLLIVPMLLPGVNLVVLWRFLFTPNMGLLSQATTALGLPIFDPLHNTSLALWMIILMGMWQNSPLVMLIFYSAFSSIPPEIIKAAKIDGAGKLELARHIMLPAIRNVILVILLIKLIDAFRIFEKVYLLTQGGPGIATQTIQLQIYTRGVFPLAIGFGSAMSVILVLLSMVVIIPYIYFTVRIWRRPS